jgi:ankyrin repeat protein
MELTSHGGYTEIVRFLCQQSGIDPHIQYVKENGNTVFHLAARMISSELFRLLFDPWHEGINMRNKSEITPLALLISDNIGCKATVESVKFLLSTGKVDATGSNDEPGDSPLCRAIRNRDLDICRILIVDNSADMSCAVGVDEDTGKPFLTKHVKVQDKLEDQEMILKELLLLPSSNCINEVFVLAWEQEGINGCGYSERIAMVTSFS